MNELITIEVKEKDGQQLVDARAVHAFLEISRDFSHWWQDQRIGLELVENLDWCVLRPQGTKTIGRPSLEIALTLDTAKHICLASKTEKGKELRKYFIEVEKRYKAQPQLSVLDTLKIAVKELEKKEIIIQEKNKQIAIMKPNHDFVNKVFTAAETNVKIGDFAQAAAFKDPYNKGIIGQNKMFKLLRDLSILKNKNLPMTAYINAGYFKVVEKVKEDINKVFFTTYVTPKGQKWLHKRINDYLKPCG